jgi:hypothetical protein
VTGESADLLETIAQHRHLLSYRLRDAPRPASCAWAA